VLGLFHSLFLLDSYHLPARDIPCEAFHWIAAKGFAAKLELSDYLAGVESELANAASSIKTALSNRSCDLQALRQNKINNGEEGKKHEVENVE